MKPIEYRWQNSADGLYVEIHPFGYGEGSIITVSRRTDLGTLTLRDVHIGWPSSGHQTIPGTQRFQEAMTEALKIALKFNTAVYRFHVTLPPLPNPGGKVWEEKILGNDISQVKATLGEHADLATIIREGKL